jgi:NADH-quinone oxidoreductase subunit H
MIFLRNPTLDDFGIDPWWLIVIKVLGVFVVLVLLTLFSIWAERRVVAKMQIRVGPNRVGPFGLLQSLFKFWSKNLFIFGTF